MISPTINLMAQPLLSDEPLTALLDHYLDTDALADGLPLYVSLYPTAVSYTHLRTNCARSLSALRPVNSLPVRWTGYLTLRRASVLPLLHARFCVPSVTRWSLLPALYGTCLLYTSRCV